MSNIRKLAALAALVGGLGGTSAVVADSSLVSGSTADAGVVTICAQPTLCHPSGPPHAGPIITVPVHR
jgi:hypothetical protein